MTSAFEVHVTAGTREEAERICAAAVNDRVAACAQIIGPITSLYRWEGRVELSEEFLILLKTGGDRLDELVSLVKGAHSYETPEIVAVPIEGGLPDYLNWIARETADRPQVY
ncbi:divalent-cation tolerance protein CutA [Streptosporangium sp. NPDC048047]|uniref:divalent-cation tolerance protein CutA n=1 Tax=Streptosporangium sp. NPDC048047 TaxID=3155748 RepID=UPI0034416AE6